MKLFVHLCLYGLLTLGVVGCAVSPQDIDGDGYVDEPGGGD